MAKLHLVIEIKKIVGELSFEIFGPRHRHLSIRNKSYVAWREEMSYVVGILRNCFRLAQRNCVCKRGK